MTMRCTMNPLVLLPMIIIITLLGCANPTMSDPETSEPAGFLKEIVLVEDQFSAFSYQDEFYVVGFKETGGGVTDITIQKGDDTQEISLVSRQPKKVMGLWWMTTWVSSLDGLAGLIVSDTEPDADHAGPPLPGEFIGPDDASDPHPHDYYENEENQSTSGRVEPYDYSYGPRPSPGDTIILKVKLNSDVSGDHLLRVALGDDSSIIRADVPRGNSVHELELKISSDIESGWHTFRFTTMTEGGDIIYNSSEGFWVRIE